MQKLEIFEKLAQNEFKPRGSFPPPLPAIRDCCPLTAGSKNKCSKGNVLIYFRFIHRKDEKQRTYFGREEGVDDKDKRLQRN